MKSNVIPACAIASALFVFVSPARAEGDAVKENLAWPEPTREMKPWAYNWWMANAVEETGMEFQCSEMAAKGFGGFHVIPIYGAYGPDNCFRSKWVELLSPEWVEKWNMAARKAKAHDLGIDLTMGSGWCFGGPWITAELGVTGGQKVKRPSPGGAGYMLDPYNPEAMKVHVAQFDPIFGKNGTAERPRAFYHDSWEYYNAKMRTPGDIDDAVLATFKVWTDWCRENGYLTRNEAHGSTANWLDFYALADIPETEMFAKKDRDILISKFASSAAHIKGTKLVSAESCTWIDEHFCERPEEIKIFLDRLFLSGVNHVFYHGLCYSPVDVVWPGWCFYASLEMNPRNPIWREVGALNAYVTRCQSMFQTWQSDNDMLILWDPDSFRKKPGNEFRQMAVHGLDWFYGEKIGPLAKKLYDEGYAFDFISPRQLADPSIDKTRYAQIIDPANPAEPAGVRKMPFNASNGLLATRWKKDGKTMYFVVNQGETAKEIVSKAHFHALSPLSGMIVQNVDHWRLMPNHSVFVIGEDFAVETAPELEKTRIAEAKSTWHVAPVCGGPETPEPRDVKELKGWQTWDEAYSGTMKYSTRFDAPGAKKIPSSDYRILDLGDVREIARVKLNGIDLGVRFMKPYAFGIPAGLLREKNNKLEVEVTSLGANRIRWNDRNKINWKYFADTNMVTIDYKKFDASGWPVMTCGLLGPVEVYSCKKTVRLPASSQGSPTR